MDAVEHLVHVSPRPAPFLGATPGRWKERCEDRPLVFGEGYAWMKSDLGTLHNPQFVMLTESEWQGGRFVRLFLGSRSWIMGLRGYLCLIGQMRSSI